MTDVTELLTGVLAEHPFHLNADPACGCRTEDLVPGWDDGAEEAHRAHLAAALAPVVARAQAEALRDAAVAIQTACPNHMSWDYTPIDAAYDAAARIARDRASDLDPTNEGENHG